VGEKKLVVALFLYSSSQNHAWPGVTQKILVNVGSIDVLLDLEKNLEPLCVSFSSF
jgi:hypothetical protein